MGNFDLFCKKTKIYFRIGFTEVVLDFSVVLVLIIYAQYSRYMKNSSVSSRRACRFVAYYIFLVRYESIARGLENRILCI